MIVKAWCKSECSLTKSSKPGTPVLPSPLPHLSFPPSPQLGRILCFEGLGDYLGLTQIIQDNLITLGSLPLISSAKFLCPAKQHTQILGVKDVDVLGGGHYSAYYKI